MVKRMKLWVAGALLLAVGGTVVASNMGFKFVPNLNQTGKTFTISLPLNNNYTNASSVFNDINASCPGAPQLVERMVPSAGGTVREDWNGTGTDFTVNSNEGLIVVVNPTCTSWVIVGSHNPAYVYTFAQAGKNYLTSIPYHTTATVANDLFTSIPSAVLIERITPTAGGGIRQSWNGTGVDFPVTIGESYVVVVGTAGTNWTPSHY